ANLRPREPGGQPDLVVLFYPEFAELQDSEEIVNVRWDDFGFDRGAFGNDFTSHLAADVLNFTFQVSDAGLLRIVANDVEQAFIGEGKILIGDSGGFPRALDQEALGDFHLFLLRVTRQAQDFHAVLQRLRNGVQHVRGADEHYF